MSNIIFNNFLEYWYFAKKISEKQREVLFSSFSKEQQNILLTSFKNEGWDDLFFRNLVDNCLDKMKLSYGIDILKIRCNAIKGKPFIIKKEQWNYFNNMLKQVDNKHKIYVLGNIKATPYNNNTLIIEKI
jgi:Golgi nucleoside diphosphatase